MKNKNSQIVESLIHKKILLEHMIYATQQIELQTKFNIKDINELLTSYQTNGEIKNDVLKATSLNLRNTLNILNTQQIKEIQSIIRKLLTKLKNI